MLMPARLRVLCRCADIQFDAVIDAATLPPRDALCYATPLIAAAADYLSTFFTSPFFAVTPPADTPLPPLLLPLVFYVKVAAERRYASASMPRDTS